MTDQSDEFAEYDAFEKRMIETYPIMFSEPFGGFAISKGWWPIVESLCAQIQHYTDWKHKHGHHIPQAIVAQIKEKFGGLRFYYSGGDETVSGMVTMAEAWAARSCEVCGAPGHLREGGWLVTMCGEHYEEREKERKERASYDE